MSTFSIILLLLLIGLTVYHLRQRRAWISETQKKEMEAKDQLSALRERHLAANQAFFDSLPDCYLTISYEGTITGLNQQTRQIFGERAIKGRTLEESLLESALIEPIRLSLKKKESLTKQIRFAPNSIPSSQSGNTAETYWQLETIPLNSEHQTGLMVILRDISQSIRAENIRKDFVANASHELRTPLTIVTGYLENLLEDDILTDPETSRYMVGAMQKHVERINRIIEEMLLISKLESGEASALKLEVFDLRDCLNDVMDRLELLFEKQGATSLILFHPEQILIKGDRFYWTQIFFNLIENALKQNSSLSIQITVEARLLPDQRGLQIEITDNGVGIPSADVPYIFNRFYRVEKHHSQEKIKGTGLGLSIVKRAVEAHGGQITARSTPGVATTFAIKLPHTIHSSPEDFHSSQPPL